MSKHTPRSFSSLLDVIRAAREAMQTYKSDPDVGMESLRADLKELRMRSGYYMNVENPFFPSQAYTPPLTDEDLVEVYGNALFNTILANYLSHYIREIEAMAERPSVEC